jgi:hypothetical protein
MYIFKRILHLDKIYLSKRNLINGTKYQNLREVYYSRFWQLIWQLRDLRGQTYFFVHHSY